MLAVSTMVRTGGNNDLSALLRNFKVPRRSAGKVPHRPAKTVQRRRVVRRSAPRQYRFFEAVGRGAGRRSRRGKVTAAQLHEILRTFTPLNIKNADFKI